MERGKKNIQLVRFGAELGLRHRYIYRAPGIEDIVLAFVQKSQIYLQGSWDGGYIEGVCTESTDISTGLLG